MSPSASPSDPSSAPVGLYKALVSLATVAALLAVLCVHLMLGGGSGEPRDTTTGAGLRDAAREAEEIAAMVSGRSGTWDSHPDADVSRVLQPSVTDRDYLQHDIYSNRFGMHERDYALPKPADVLRVVLLGDSFIFGHGVDSDERLGVVLERALEGRRQEHDATIEVLHFGIPGWNLVAECAFLRRQLSLLQPDLVVHFSVSNDLGDTSGVRGFGAMGKLVPRRPAQGDTIIRQGHARWALDTGATGHLARGLDGESRTRFDEAGAELERLVAAVTRAGGRYLHVFNWAHANPIAAQQLAPRLADEQRAWLPLSFSLDDAMRVSAGDPHWNPAGHERVAQMVFGLITARELLPRLRLLPWGDADEAVVALDERGRREALSPAALQAQLSGREIPSALVLSRITADSASLVHGGIDADGLVGPYASVMLTLGEARRLRLKGRCLDRPELDGAHLTVFVDELQVARLPLVAGRPLSLDRELPAELAGRPAVSVRFVSDDFVYAGDELRHCVSFVLESVAVVP